MESLEAGGAGSICRVSPAPPTLLPSPASAATTGSSMPLLYAKPIPPTTAMKSAPYTTILSEATEEDDGAGGGAGGAQVAKSSSRERHSAGIVTFDPVAQDWLQQWLGSTWPASRK
eukprot:SAG31_NODE_592_length_13726_cov_7.188082_5_plen_116_part_00